MSATLEDGARVAVVGGGPAGTLSAYFLLSFAKMMDLDLGVDIYEPRNFAMPGPAGCNMCGGIVSESLVQALAIEGIELPVTVVQRGIDSYVLHTADGPTRIDTPLKEQRIAAIHRGGGPRDVSEVKWGGFDGHLMRLAEELGARVVPNRVAEVGWDNGLPQVRTKNESTTYDLLIGATGINSSGWDLYESLGFQGDKPATTKVYITELMLGYETITRHFGNSMHIFMLDLPRLDCAALIPKGDFVTLCLLGEDIDREFIDGFFANETVRRCFPEDFNAGQGACHCQPRINVKEARQPFMDRAVLVGDSGATRLYKDGIGAAYRTAKAAAATAVFGGVSAADFEKTYWPIYRSIAGDNRYGTFMFDVVHRIKGMTPLVRGMVRMTANEQRNSDPVRRMSMVLWDMFTGSAPYKDVFFRTLSPRFATRYLFESALSLRKGSSQTVA